jgi:hypothetical protein
VFPIHFTFALVVTLAAPSLSSAEPVAIYVAPTGSDDAPGTVEKPFRSPARARDAVRQLKKRNGGKLTAPVTVHLRGGTFALGEPFVLNQEDGGTAAFPVTYAAHGEEKPVLSGGRPVSGWVKRPVRGGEVWEAKVPSPMPGGGPLRSLWVNGARRTRARHPDKGEGFLKVVEVPGATPQTEWTQGLTGFRFKEGDLPGTLPAGAEVVLNSRWVESRLPVTKVDAAQRLVHFDRKSVFITQVDDRYWVEGAAEFLTEPGEWHYDRQASALHYRPMPNEVPEKVQAFVPAMAQVLLIQGDPASGKFLEHVHFRGVAFAHTEWGHDSPGADNTKSGFSQAAIGVPSAIHAVGAKSCAFDRCTFSNLGTYALHLAGGCTNNKVTHCTFTDLGAGGVKIGETSLAKTDAQKTHHNEVSDCRITDGGNLFPSAIGVWIGQSSDNTIGHNEIADFYYTGISVGWTWGYDTSLAKGNVIEHNHVHHIGRPSDEPEPVLSDMAGIYTLGVQPGTVIRHNRFHDIAGIKYGGWGIYFDEGTSNVVAENNVVYRTTHGGFHQHYGRDNVFRNNVIALGRDYQVQRTRAESHLSFTFERNIVYWQQGQPLAGGWENCNVRFDRNVYWKEGGGAEFKPPNLTVQQWREKGMDANSVVADPKFTAPDKDDFTLRPDSPAPGVGFVPFNQRDVGPRGK